MSDLKININKANNLQDLAEILSNSKVSLSFLGIKNVSNPKFSSTVSIAFIAKKALSLLTPLLKDWHYSLKDRKNITIIMQRIDGFYFETDELLNKSNFITQFFCWFLESTIVNFMINCFQGFPYRSSAIRRSWEKPSEGKPSDPVNFYTKNQYKKAFPNNYLPEDPDDKYKNTDFYLPPDKINSWYRRLF